MSRHHIINSKESGTEVINDLRKLYVKHNYLVVTVNVGFDITAAQTKLQDKWHTEMSLQSKDTTNKEWRAYCELAFGVPIACRNDVKREAWEAVVSSMDYEKLLKFIEFNDVSVTRDFNKEEMAEYLDKVYEFAEQQGWKLTEPSKYDKK